MRETNWFARGMETPSSSEGSRRRRLLTNLKSLGDEFGRGSKVGFLPMMKSSPWSAGSGRKTIFDTNIWVSALLEERGASHQLVRIAGRGVLSTSSCSLQRSELRRVLISELELTEEETSQALELVQGMTMNAEPVGIIVGERGGINAADRALFTLAFQTGATLVTGDKGLLALDGELGVRVRAPRAFLDEIQEKA